MGDEAAIPGTCSSTASMSSRVMESSVVVLSGPAILPPEYCISIMFGPMLEMRLSAYSLPVRPRVTTSTIEAEPITIPSIVSRNLTLLALKLSKASCSTSLKSIVLRALARVRSNELSLGFSTPRLTLASDESPSGFGMFAVAIAKN